MTWEELKQWAANQNRDEIIIYNNSIDLDYGGFSLTLESDGTIMASDGFAIVDGRTPKQMKCLLEVLL